MKKTFFILVFISAFILLLSDSRNLVQAAEDHPGQLTFHDVQGWDLKYNQDIYEGVDECARFGVILQEATEIPVPFVNPGCRDTFVGAWTGNALRDTIPNIEAGILRGDHFIVSIDGREVGTYFAEDAVLRNPDGTIKTFTTSFTFGLVVFLIPPMNPGVHELSLTIVAPGIGVVTPPPIAITVHRPNE